MTIVIEAAPDIEETIMQEAAREGVTPQEYVLQAAIEKARAATSVQPQPAANGVSETLTGDGPTYAGFPIGNNATLALFAQWEEEDATDDPEEIARRQREGDEFIANLQANRFNIPRDPELLRILELPEDDDEQAKRQHSA
jgi:hypothetical protein